jgi:hypothetical protein
MKAFRPKLGEVQAIYPAFAWEGSYVALTRFFYVQFENLHLIKGAVYFLQRCKKVGTAVEAWFIFTDKKPELKIRPFLKPLYEGCFFVSKIQSG